MVRTFLIIIISLASLTSCTPKSYCFFNAAEKSFYISDKRDESIKSITVASEDSSFSRKDFELLPPVKKYKLDTYSVVNKRASFLITTDTYTWYYLKLEEGDWASNKIYKCRHLIK